MFGDTIACAEATVGAVVVAVAVAVTDCYRDCGYANVIRGDEIV